MRWIALLSGIVCGGLIGCDGKSRRDMTPPADMPLLASVRMDIQRSDPNAIVGYVTQTLPKERLAAIGQVPVNDFRLGQVFPWIPEAERLLAQGDLLTLYRQYVLGATWTYLKKRAEDYYFSFEAVVLYIARWDIIRRWQQLQAERGRAIFETLVTEALGEYANIYS